MKIGIFDPYLDTLGGGEKYMLTAAECLAKKHEVWVFWNDSSLKKKAEERFGFDLPSVKFVKNIFTPQVSLFSRLWMIRDYNFIFYLSDGSIPFVFGKKLILHFQFPVEWVVPTWWIKKKLSFARWVICNSKFTKTYIDKKFGIESLVVYPPCQVKDQFKFPKENIILNVGRTGRLPEVLSTISFKKQEIMIETFKKMVDEGLCRWRLVIIGSVLSRDEDFVVNLIDKAKGYPINIFKNIPFLELMSYYQKAKIYWHAAGFGEDLRRHPEYAEHFGISTVEAMGGGAVPIVFNAGGQREIIKDNKNGFLWKTPQELQDKTLWVIRDVTTWQRLSESAKLTSKAYSKERFCQKLNEIITK